MLGGFGHVHDPDIKTSIELLRAYKNHISGFNRVIDMGAGIGRVTKALLIPRFKEVDILEPSEIQLNQA